MTDRTHLMAQFAEQAAEYDRRGDTVLRRQASDSWRELATDEEAAEAPDYLLWTGRRGGRPPATPEQRAAWKRPRTIRLSDEHWHTLQALGVAAWLEPRLERAARAQGRADKALEPGAATTVPPES